MGETRESYLLADACHAIEGASLAESRVPNVADRVGARSEGAALTIRCSCSVKCRKKTKYVTMKNGKSFQCQRAGTRARGRKKLDKKNNKRNKLVDGQSRCRGEKKN